MEHAQGLGTTNLYPANSKFYQQMIDAIDSMGHGYMSPWFYALHGSLLDKNVKEVQNMVNGYHVTRKLVTLSCKQTLINFLIYYPRELFS